MDLDVVVCAKNRAALLQRVLKQIIHEIPFKDLIVIYGSSGDGTREVAKRYTKNVFWDGDKGLGAARNLGIRKAGSDLVAMIDTDIILTKDWYKRLVRHFENDEVAAAMGATLYGYGNRPIQSLYEYLRWNMKEDWGCTNTIFRRKFVLDVGNFDQNITGAGEDYDLYMRLLTAGYRYVWDREVVVHHPMSFSELIAHVSWWARGVPFVRRLVVQLKTCSLIRIYCRFAFSILLSLRDGIRLAFVVHPSTLFLLPIIETVRATATLRQLKEILNTRT